jgi:spermidine synthase
MRWCRPDCSEGGQQDSGRDGRLEQWPVEKTAGTSVRSASDPSAASRDNAGTLKQASSSHLPEVQFSDEGRIRHLHLDSIWIQGSMDLRDPVRLVHEYVQRMMAWLLFVEPDSVPQRRAMQLGLGAGSLTKFCVKMLRMPTTVIELNPGVLHACRGWFHLPEPGPLLDIVLADAEQEIQNPKWWGTVDALQVDLYDHEAAAPVLDSVDFYAACRRLLTDNGCMTVNLFGRRASFQHSVAHMAEAFGSSALWRFKATREGNTVVLAFKQGVDGADPGALLRDRGSRAVLSARAEAIEARWGLPATKWLKGLEPVQAISKL